MAQKVHITFNDDTYNKLQRYLRKKYGPDSRAMSSTVQRAVREFLEREGELTNDNQDNDRSEHLP